MPGVGEIGGLTPQVPVIPIPTSREEETIAVTPRPEQPEVEEVEPEKAPTGPQGVGANLDMTA